MKLLPALAVFALAASNAFAADCSTYPNARYEEYWGYNSAYFGRMMCASYGMSSGECSSLGGDWKNDSGSGSAVCFLEPREEADPPAQPEPPEEPVPPPAPPAPRPQPQPQPPRPAPIPTPYQHTAPSGADKSHPWFKYSICNRTGDGTAYVAVVAPDHFGELPVVFGWWSVADGTCREILERDFGSWQTQFQLQVHVETAHKVWPGAQTTWTQKCIANYAPYHRPDTSGYRCLPGETVRPFFNVIINRGDKTFFDQTTVIQ